jgi:hypothetical protein
MKKETWKIIRKIGIILLVVTLLAIASLIIMNSFFNAKYIRTFGTEEEKCWLDYAESKCENGVNKVGDNFIFTSTNGGDFEKATGFKCKMDDSVFIIPDSILEECKNG